VSGSVIQVELVGADLNLDYSDTSPLTRLDNSGIDDPVNDTGPGLHRGDLQISDQFACLVNLFCMEDGDFR
jgi:hypothetical protein